MGLFLIEMFLPGVYIPGRGGMNCFNPAISKQEGIISSFVVHLPQPTWMGDIFRKVWGETRRVPLTRLWVRGRALPWTPAAEEAAFTEDQFLHEYEKWVAWARKYHA